jgi:hypothetical protein
MEKRIVVCIGTDRSGGVRARLSLMLMDGKDVVHEHFHSVSLLPGDDIEGTRRAIEQHLAQPKVVSGIPSAPWPRIPDVEWAKVEAVCAIFHTSKN